VALPRDFPRLESRSRRERALKGLNGRKPSGLQAFRPRTGRERPSGRGNDPWAYGIKR